VVVSGNDASWVGCEEDTGSITEGTFVGSGTGVAVTCTGDDVCRDASGRVGKDPEVVADPVRDV
jgi:hypothetical protein